MIGAQDPHWGERPVAVVSLRQGQTVTGDELRSHLQRFVDEGKIAKFWIPERFVISAEQLPKTSTGKMDKKPLREKYGGMLTAS